MQQLEETRGMPRTLMLYHKSPSSMINCFLAALLTLHVQFLSHSSSSEKYPFAIHVPV